MCTGAEAAMVALAVAGTASAAVSASSKPSMGAQPKTPSKSDQDVEEAGAKERMLARLRKGRASTILTPLTAESTGGGSTGKKTLLGA